MFACLYRPPLSSAPANALVPIAHDSSPRYEVHGDDLVVIDVAGLERLIGPPRVIGDELRRAAAARGIRAHVALASTHTAARALALTRPGLTVIEPGAEAAALALIALEVFASLQTSDFRLQTSDFRLQTFHRWGIRTFGELAALPAADLVSRLGRQALAWQAVARGEDLRPLVPAIEEERFESALELEWPIEGLEPLSFVLTRLLEPLSTRLERRDRGAVVLHVLLRLVTRDTYARRLELPSPMRDVRTLRTLALLDLESHPPAAAIDRVTVVIEPTPGRVLQHTLFTRAHPTPEQVSTLVARLGALMGQDRIGAPVTVDTDRPGAFAIQPFRLPESNRGHGHAMSHQPSAMTASAVPQALRRCRFPVPARVAVAKDLRGNARPVRVSSDRRGFAGGAVVQCAGPWRTSGEWWAGGAGGAGGAGRAGRTEERVPPVPPIPPVLPSWDHEEWDVALADGTVYRVFQDRETAGWFIEAIVD